MAAPTIAQREFAQSVAQLFEKTAASKGDIIDSETLWMERSKGERAGWMKVVSFIQGEMAKKPEAKSPKGKKAQK